MATVRTRSVGDRYTTEVKAGQHRLVLDEPAPDGDNGGPSPYEMLLAALGGCTTITLLMYARRSRWPLEAVEIELSHDREHIEDCERCEDEHSRIDVIRRRIHLEGPLTPEQRERLLEIARRCPVHRTLTSAPVIRDELV